MLRTGAGEAAMVVESLTRATNTHRRHQMAAATPPPTAGRCVERAFVLVTTPFLKGHAPYPHADSGRYGAAFGTLAAVVICSSITAV